jgi:hypothetical protein
MSWQELAGEFLWFAVNVAVAAVALLSAVICMGLCYFRGTRSGRLPLYGALISLILTIACWLIFVYPDPPASMICAAVTSLATFMAFGSWFGRYDRS